MLTLRDALTRATDQLAANPHLGPTALPDAALLIEHTLGITRATLRAHPERLLTRDELASYQALVTRRLAFEPIQYILGTQEFFGLTLKVTPAVLIPRPETESLVEAVLAEVAAGRTPPDARILDIGTGSGAIAIALAHSLPQARLTAVDISAETLEVARANAASHELAGRIAFVESDLLAGLALEGRFDVVASNPPYVPRGDAESLHPQVRDHEPPAALFAGDEGLDVYRRLIPDAGERLVQGGLLALEIGYGQREVITQMLAGWDDVRFVDDLQHIPRVALARRR